MITSSLIDGKSLSLKPSIAYMDSDKLFQDINNMDVNFIIDIFYFLFFIFLRQEANRPTPKMNKSSTSLVDKAFA
jgi:hypothetical protein